MLSLLRLRPRTTLWTALVAAIFHARLSLWTFFRVAVQLRADLIKRALRAHVARAHMEQDRFGPPECMLDHQRLHLAVRAGAPLRTLQERVPDHDRAIGRIPLVVAR